MTTTAYELGQYFQSISAYTLVNGTPPVGGAGNDVGVGPIYHQNATPKQITWELLLSGAPATITANLEGTLDEPTAATRNWAQLDQTTLVAGFQSRNVVFKPYRYYRVNITVVSGATGTANARIFFA